MYSAYKLNKQSDNIQPYRTPFPILNYCSMSGSKCCSLTYTLVSQEAGKVIWYSITLRIFQFVVIHTVKGFSIVEAEVDVFLEFSCSFYDPTNVGNLISGFSAFSKFSLYIWKFLVHLLLKLA